jgi:ABC-type nitrate/sulfonate/bicarbonate transport system ATPase subunit
MLSSGMLRRVALVRTEVSEEEYVFLQEPHGVTSQKRAFLIITYSLISSAYTLILF